MHSTTPRRPLRRELPGVSQKPAGTRRRRRIQCEPQGTGRPPGGALLIVLILIAASAKLLQRRGLTPQHRLPPEVLEVLGRGLVDERNAIHLVRCGSRLLVLGSSVSGLTSLTEIDDPAEVESLAALCRSRENVTVAESITKLFQRRPTTDQGRDPRESELDPATIRLQERLQPVSFEAEPAAEFPSIRGAAP